MGECKLCPWCCKEEFEGRNLGLHHHDSTLFVASQWPRFSRGLFVIYRVSLALVVTAWVIFNIVDEITQYYFDDVGVWFAYATNWGFMLLAIILIILCIQTVYYYFRPDNLPEDGSLPCNIKMTWMMYTMCCNANIVITICFWFFLFFMSSSFYFRTMDSQTKHSFNTVVVILDLMVSATPIRLLHFVYPITLGLVYAAFNLIYYLLDGPGPDGRNHYVYAVMDWDRPYTATGIVFVGLGLCLIAQVTIFLVYRLRLFIYSKCYPKKKDEGETTKIIEDEDNHTYDAIQLNSNGDAKSQ